MFLSAQSDISRWSLTKPLIGDDDVPPFFRKSGGFPFLLSRSRIHSMPVAAADVAVYDLGELLFGCRQ